MTAISQHIAQVVARLRKCRLQPQRLTIAGDGFVNLLGSVFRLATPRCCSKLPEKRDERSRCLLEMADCEIVPADLKVRDQAQKMHGIGHAARIGLAESWPMRAVPPDEAGRPGDVARLEQTIAR